MKNIEQLTPNQAAELPRFRARWLAHGLSTERANRPRAQAAISQMYREIGKPAPAFFWFDSPASAALAVGLLRSLKDRPSLRDQLGGQLRDQLRDQLGDQLGDQLWDQLWGQLGDQLGDQLGGQLGGQLWGQLRDQLWGQLGDQLGDQLGGQLGGQLWGQLRDQLWGHARRSATSEAFWGQHEAYWIAYYSFAADIGVKYTAQQSARLRLWSDIAQSCGWWMPYDGLCVVSERPTTVSFDTERRLHSQTGPALAFADGYRLWRWHGTDVPESWITAPDKLDPKTALTWTNIEQRRAAAEIMGWRRVLEQLSPRVIDKDPNPELGELLEVDLPDAGSARFLKVRCGTGRDFVLSVPREMTTAIQANAWTYDISPEELKKSEART